VRHGGRALLLFAEELLDFPYFGTLQVAKLGGDLVQGASNHGQSGNIRRMAIALDHLG
jgi:hypothetical protein